MRPRLFASHAAASRRWVRFAKRLFELTAPPYDASIAVKANVKLDTEVAMHTPSTSRPSLFGSD